MSLRTSSTHVVGMRAAGDQEARERLRDPERDGGQRPWGASPPFSKVPTQNRPCVPALHVAATPADRVALDRLTLEGVALGRPVGQVARLEAEIERPALAVLGNGAGSTRLFARVSLPMTASRPSERRQDGHQRATRTIDRMVAQSNTVVREIEASDSTRRVTTTQSLVTRTCDSSSRSLHGDHVLDLGELDFLDALDLHDVFDGLERPGVDDRLRLTGPMPGRASSSSFEAVLMLTFWPGLSLGMSLVVVVGGLGRVLAAVLAVAVLAAAGAVVVTRSLRASIRACRGP